MKALHLFEAMGVVNAPENHIHRFFVDGATHEVHILDADTGGKVQENTSRFRSVFERSASSRADFYDIVLETSDVRDVMAFCYSAEHGTRFSLSGDAVPEEYQFEWEGTSIVNGFADEQYGEWVGDATTSWPHNDDGRAVLVTPAAERPWGEAYLTWRDNLAIAIMEQEIVPTLR